MSFRKLLNTPVTIIEPGRSEDAYGDQQLDWTTAQRRGALAWVTDISRSEVIDGRDALLSSWLLYLDGDDPITGFARVEISGKTYEVNGPPSSSNTPSKGVHHTECRLLLVEG